MISSGSCVVDADRPGVDAGQFLEQHHLPLHHRQSCRGAEVSQPQHRGAVRDDCDAVALNREGISFRRLLRDGLADAPDAGRIDHGEHIAGGDGDFALNPDFTPEVQEENSVGRRQDVYLGQCFQPLEDPLSVGLILHVEGHVTDHAFGIGRHDVDRTKVGPLLCQQGGDLGEDAGSVEKREADGQAVV